MRKWKRPVKGQTVMVYWLDICSDSSWLDSEKQDAFRPSRCRAVGTVLSCDDHMLKLAHNICLEDGKSDLSVYPIGVIEKVVVLSDGQE